MAVSFCQYVLSATLEGEVRNDKEQVILQRLQFAQQVSDSLTASAPSGPVPVLEAVVEVGMQALKRIDAG